MKKIFKKQKGFTISEMLMVMLLLSVIALAIVAPAAKPKLVKKDNSNIPHGIFECYYKDGILYEYYVDNKENKNTAPRAVKGDSCIFTPPKANYFKFQLVGAGADGYEDAVGHRIDTTTHSEENEVFIEQLGTLAPDIKNAINNSNLKTTLTMTSGTGSGGAAYCEVRQDLSNCGGSCNCNSCSGIASSSWGECCKETISKKGQNSGFAKSLIYQFTIKTNNLPDCTVNGGNAEFVRNGKSCKLFASTSGDDATEESTFETMNTNAQNSTDFCTDFRNNIKTTHISSKGGECGTNFVNNKVSGDSAQNASCNYNPSSIYYKREIPYLHVTYGKNGEAGKVVNFTYPNLNGAQLRITPARTNDDTETAVFLGNMTILRASTGEYQDETYEKEIGDISHYDAYTSPLEYDPENIKDIEKPIMADINDTGLISAIEQNNIEAGKPGHGTYPYINEVNYSTMIRIEMPKGTHKTDKNNKSKRTLNTSIKCKDGSKPKIKNNRKYCASSKGESGAVRIVW